MRVGAKVAKLAKKLLTLSEQLAGEDAASFRAFAAKANYLALGQPDLCSATTDLCRTFAHPTKHSVGFLKHCVRYLIGCQRLV